LRSSSQWTRLRLGPSGGRQQRRVLPAFTDGGTSLVWTWFAVAWTYAILLVPILLLPAAVGRREDLALADSYSAGDVTTKAAVAAAWMAQHQFGGALLGEHLGQLLAIEEPATLRLAVAFDELALAI
jgi:hypothetical protein